MESYILETKQKGLFEQQSNFQLEKKIWENQSNGHVVNQLPNVRYRDCFFKGLVGRKKSIIFSIYTDRREDFYENVVCIFIVAPYSKGSILYIIISYTHYVLKKLFTFHKPLLFSSSSIMSHHIYTTYCIIKINQIYRLLQSNF